MATTNDAIYISDDDGDESPRSPAVSSVKEEEEGNLVGTPLEAWLLSSPDTKQAASRAKRIRTGATTASPVPAVAGYSTPIRMRKRRTSGALDDMMKPITPSATIQSSMNASLVFDMVTSLSTNDPGVAIAALRSIVVLGKEYPSNLLFDELIDRMLGVEAIAYADAVSIYASLVFVFDKAASCSCDLAFPHQWDPLANALQDAASLPASDERWRRDLLVVQFFIYCFKKDFDICRERYQHHDKDTPWIYRTRLFMLLHHGDAMASTSSKRASANRHKIQNNLILQAISASLALWQRVFDDSASNDSDLDKSGAKLEAEDTCLAVVRLIEMLYLCTDQVQNLLQRLQAGLLELSRETRVVFSQALQLADLKVRLATTVLGLTNKARSKEHEWYECNALGRLMQSIHKNDTTTVAASREANVTEAYSLSHFDSFMTAPPRNDVAKLLQEIVRLQQKK